MNDLQSKIAGGFYGLLVGDALGVPSRWLDNLRGQEIAKPLLERLLERQSR